MDQLHPPDASTARYLVEEIWRENTANGTITEKDSELGSLVENALEIISCQIYDKDTRFLLELIQNAEDNTYYHVTPTLSFTYKKGSLRVDCNEVGFTESDVRAICKIGKSTKIGHGRSAQYVGEKGIGFKSVFKVSSIVYISSRSFSFKFDRSQAVGLIAPIWAAFPELTLPGSTSFYLKLSDNCDENQIVHDIQHLDPTMLIFLRKLKHINLSIALDDGQVWTRKLWREDMFDGQSLITKLNTREHVFLGKRESSKTARLNEGSTSTSIYIVVKDLVSRLPEDKDRAGVTESEIVLAFPSWNENLEDSTQSVYAFLPIRDYGFKFLIQGDFLLTANREDVQDSPWNRALREACADAFVKAVYRLNKGPERYTWIRYLPGQRIVGFFEPLRDLILEKLSKEPILEAFSGRMVAPVELTYVPKGNFSDDRRLPLTLSPMTKDSYLSSSYPEWAAASLSRLGTQRMDAESFLADLRRIISQDPQYLRQRGGMWHSKLAKVLLSIVNEKVHLDLVKGLKIIPLSNGDWVSANLGRIYFSQGFESLKIPGTVPLRTVHPDIENIPVRRNLLVHLGVKPRPDAADVCRLIIEMHRFKPANLSLDELVEHVIFMFKASFDPPPGVDLWFVTADNQRVKGSSLYLPARSVQIRPSEARIREHVEANYPLLHSAYADAFKKDGPVAIAWHTWVQRRLGINVSSLPRIATGAPRGRGSGTLRLSDEFRSMFKACDSSDVLDLLRVRWREYSPIVEEMYLEDPTSPKNPVRDEIAAMEVKCFLGQGSAKHCLRRLQDTFLPSLDKTIDQESCIPLLDIPSPSNQGWRALGIFGVSVYRNLGYYFQCLFILKNSGVDASKTTITHIYERIQADYMDHKREICKMFMKQNLIYTSLLCATEGDPTMRWVSAQECLEKNLDISAEYSSSATLFRNVLGTGADDIERLVQTMCAITEEARLSDILKSFSRIDRAIRTQGARNFKAAIEKLNRWVPIFPILKEDSGKEYDALAPLNPAFPPWFIADRHHLRDSFNGSVDILAFSPQEIQSIEVFLKVLDLESRFLSKIVKVESRPMGKPKRHKAYTLSLRRKAAFITALIPRQQQNREASVGEFFRAEVSIAAEIVEKYSFEYGRRFFSGADSRGDVCLSESNGRLQVFMTRENILATLPPPELGNRICDRYNITNPAHRHLVHFALGEHGQDRLSSTFAREGVHVLESLPRNLESDYAALWRDEFVDTRISDGEDDEKESSQDTLQSKFSHIPARFIESADEDDRRLPLQYFKWSETILFRKTSGDPGTDYRTVLRTEPAHGQYAAEVLTSKFLQRELGQVYKPEDHWTSPQRYKAGYRRFPHPASSCATFTLGDREASRKFSDFIAQRGFKDAQTWAWVASDPTYHFDIAVSSGGPDSDFSWNTQQFERMRNFRTDMQRQGTWRHENVHVLVRVSDVFNNPRIDLFVDPWRLLASNMFSLRGKWTFAAAILDAGYVCNDRQSSLCASTEHIQISPPTAPPSLSGTRSPSHYGNTSSPLSWASSGTTRMSSPANNGHGLPHSSSFGPHQPHHSVQVTPSESQPVCLEQSQYRTGQNSPLLHPWHMQIGHHVQPSLPPTWPRQLYPPESHHFQGHPRHWSHGPNDNGMPNSGLPWPTAGHNMSSMASNKNPLPLGPSPMMPQQLPYAAPDLSTAPHSISISASDASVFPSFSYKPLNKGDIRLLMLHPGKEDAQLRAVVYHSPLLVTNSFQAISYTWGSTELSHTLWTPDGNVRVTESLYATLRCIRHEKQALVVWADGVCINQSDKKEKSEQIWLLPQVFQRATCVLACLGSDNSADNAIESLMQIRVKDSLATLGEEWPVDLPQIPKSWKNRCIPPSDDQIWDEIRGLFERPWFERAWIIQEVVVATSVRVICSKWMIDWNDIFAAVEIIMRESHTPLGQAQDKFWRFLTLAGLREREAKHDRRPLLELLENFRDFKSSFEHDRIFCLLGLAIDGNHSDFVLDYQLSFDAIVRKYAWTFVQQGKVMELIHRAGIGCRKTQYFPSWIPDWTIGKPDSLRTLSAWGMPCAASTRAELRVETGQMMNDLELRLYGILVDEIRCISKSSNVAEQLSLYLNEVNHMVGSSSSHLQDGLNWKVPIASATRGRHDSLTMSQSYTALRKYLAMEKDNIEAGKARVGEQRGSREFTDHVESRDVLWKQSRNYYLALQGNLVGWKFFVTKRQYVGIAPPTAREGDVVSVLNAGAVPFLLRREEVSKGHFLLVGECYVSGLMDGEAERLGIPEEIIAMR